MTSLPFKPSGWSVAHGQDFFADLIRTRSLSFDKTGSITQSPKPVVLYTDDEDADLGNILAIVADEDIYYVVTDDRLFEFDLDAGSVGKATTSSAPNLFSGSDGVSFNGSIVVSGTTTAQPYNGSSWSAGVTGLSASYPHPLCVSEHQNSLAVGNANAVRLYDTSYSLVTTCTLPAEHIVTWIRWRQNNLYIGTRNISGSGAKMFVWNGAGTAAQAGFPVHADWIYSGADFDSSIAVLTSAGELLRFNGGGFDHLAALPVYYTPYSWSSNASLSSGRGRCTNRGMAPLGDVLYINIDGSLDLVTRNYPGPYLHDQPSGLWKFDKTIGLYHAAGYCYSRYTVASVASVDSSTIVLTDPHALSTGDAVYASAAGDITGITTGGVYFAIPDSTTSFRLARTPADALAGRALTLGGSPGSATLIIEPYESFGAVHDTEPGAVFPFTKNVPPTFKGTELLFAGNTNDETGAETKSLMSLGLGRNYNSFTTTPIPADGATDAFKRFFQKIRGLHQAVDQVHVKYRTARRFGLPTMPATITWTSSTTFTVDTATFDFAAVEEGDEVDIVSGAASGRTAQITNIDRSSATYSVTIDTELDVSASDTSSVIADNWTTLGTTTSASDDADFLTFNVEAHTAWVQFKISLLGWNPAVLRIDVPASVHRPI